MTRAYKCKVFDLSDGTQQTARDLVAKYQVPLGTTRTRLSNGVRDIEILKQPPNAHKRNNCGASKGTYIPEKTVKERVAERNFFCPMSRLLLRTI